MLKSYKKSVLDFNKQTQVKVFLISARKEPISMLFTHPEKPFYL